MAQAPRRSLSFDIGPLRTRTSTLLSGGMGQNFCAAQEIEQRVACRARHVYADGFEDG
jgi:hypothetical protein